VQHSLTIEPLGPHHDRAAFSCGNPTLDDLIKTKARKENDLGYGAVFILIEDQRPRAIAGYYTLSSHFITLEGIDAASRRKLPRYPTVPATLIGRLARDLRFRGTGAGEFLLMDALRRASRSSGQVGSFAVTVDAIDDNATEFYAKFGFMPLVGENRRLWLPMALIGKLGF
jgi:predicted GNAT family N-acyltransferase